MELHSSTTVVFIGLSFFVTTVLTFPTGTTENIEIVTEQPVFFEVATEEIEAITELEERESAPEETTTLWSATDSPDDVEESSQTQFPTAEFTHPDQQEIMNELHNIWYYSEGLNEDQKDLKTSLSSLVHMTYARVYDQQDETLGRLKYLLRKLRTRLLDQEIYSDPTTTTEIVDVSDSANNATTPSQELVMRKKRSIINNDVNILTNADPNDNSLYPIMNQGDYDKPQEEELKVTLVSTATPIYTTIQKIIQVHDRLPLVTYDDDTGLTTTQMPNYTTFTTSEGTLTTTEINEIQEKDQEQIIKPATVEEIISKIISVLQSPMKTPAPIKPSPSVAHQTPIVLRLKPIASGLAINDINEEISDLPTYLKTFMGMNDKYSTDIKNTTKFSDQNSLNLTDFLSFEAIDKNGLAETNNSKSTDASEDSSSSSAVIFTPTQMLPSPTKILDGTMLGVFNLINVLANLSNAGRMILFFAISALILSIALGFNSTLGPPIAILGGLAFVIPVFLLLLYQTNKGKLKSVRDNVWNSFNIEDVKRVLELLADAADKYQ